MKNNRRNFLKKTSLAGLGLTGIGAITALSREVKNEEVNAKRVLNWKL